MILDGWGYSPQSANNAIAQAKTPNLDRLIENYPHGLLKASGLDVGLPEGVMGNSEVGHTNIGAGRIVYQDLTRIDQAISDGSFFQNPVLNEAFRLAAEKGTKLHLIGLLSDGGVHSHIRHLEALIKFAQQQKFERLIVHPVFDGRDTAPMIGETFLEQLLGYFKQYGVGQLGTLSGRYYTMDRDTRWERIEKSYDAMTLGTPACPMDPVEYIKDSHQKGTGDEFIEPVCVNRQNNIEDNDVVIFFNFRSDRARQITRAFTEKTFDGFKKKQSPQLAQYVCMTEYDQQFGLPVAFPSPALVNNLGEVVSNSGLKQLRIAETEKYAHVTFFINGGSEIKFPNEDRILIDSPRDIPTYDKKPEMSAIPVTERLLQELDRDYYDLVIVNFANCDMVGHTGIMDATVKAVEIVDQCVGQVVDKVLQKDGLVFLTADHGNAEVMVDEQGRPQTAHTSNPVRYLIISNRYAPGSLKTRDGRLSDVLPTLLTLMNLKIPAEITGQNLVE